MENMLDEMISEARREAEKWRVRLEDLESRKGGGRSTSAELALTEAIRQAINERPRTSIEVADRVERLVPGSDRRAISTIIGQRVKAGEIAKTSDLKLYIVRSVRRPG